MGIVGLHFTDKNRQYKKIIIGMAIFNGLIMIAGYYYKHY